MSKNPNMDIKLVVAQNLSRLMDQSQTLDTIKKLSSRSGVGYGTIRRAKNGDGNTTIENLVEIAKAFGLKASDLLRDQTEDQALAPVAVTIKPKSERQKRIDAIKSYVEATDDTGLAIILDKCRDVSVEYPVRAKQTQLS